MQIANRALRRLKASARRFASNTRGNVAMIFAIVLPVLLLMSFSGLDLHRATSVRMNLQDALDAATLAAARSPHVTDRELTTVGLASLRANLAPFEQITLLTDDTSFHLTEDHTVIGQAKVNVAAVVANIFLPPYGQLFDDQLPVQAHTEVKRASQNVEVSLVLDTTGSMAGTKISDLKLAAKDLVDIVVQNQQSPWTSRVALVPYAVAVNPGGPAAGTARGTVTGATNISSMTWYNGTPKAVTAVSKASAMVITSASHGFAVGDKVVVWGQGNMTQVNGKVFTITEKNNNDFKIGAVNSSSWTTFSNNGATKVAKCERADCFVTVNSNSHGIADGGYVYLSGVGGLTQLNNRSFKTDYLNANRYVIETVGYNEYTSAGQSWCAQQGCEYYTFTNADGVLTTHQISTCVTERTGTNAYTDASPATTRMGRNYPAPSNGCLANLIRPLSSDRANIKSQIDTLTATGSTGGHIGVGWGWYTLAPTFNALWSASNRAGAYDGDTLKATVIMTDGEYNSAYCNGVISKDSTTGSGAASTHINCNAPNGHPFDQTQALCRAMKARGVIVYTVGFQVVNDQRARDLVNGCATSPAHVYLPTSGSDLRQAFQAIGRDITSLRISR